jgi:hypothetical protein
VRAVLRVRVVLLPAQVLLLPRIVLIINSAAENGVGEHVNS